jgi:hypothetical protein
VRRALLLAGVALLVCCVGAAGLGAWNLQSVRRAAGPARDIADGFLKDLSAGDTGGAYDRLCTGTRQRWNRAEFARRVSASPRIVRYEVGDVDVDTQDGQLRGVVTVELSLDSGAVNRRELTVVRDRGKWQVCGDPI